jgi:hypothetical protein
MAKTAAKKKTTSTRKKPAPFVPTSIRTEDEDVVDLSPEKREQVLESIRKMLASAAQKDNPNEAAVAASTASRWMRKYNFEMKDVLEAELRRSKTAIVDKYVGDWGYTYDRYPRYLMSFAISLGKLFDCRVVLGESQLHRYPCCSFRIMGMDTDAQVVEYIFSHVNGEMNRLFDLHWEQTGQYAGVAKNSARLSFNKGCIYQILDRINDMQDEKDREEAELMKTSTGTSLMVLKIDSIHEHYGSEITYGTFKDTIASNGFGKVGREAGKNIDINQN